MLQAIMPEPGQVEIREVSRPTPAAGEVLLRIQRIGMCGSDIHVFHGRHPLTPYPVVQGHEFSAIVDAVGEGVSHLKPGMRVTSMPQIVCGRCKACQSGQEHICHELRVQGFQAPGCAQEYWVTSADKVVILPDTMSMDMGAFVEPASVGVHAVDIVPNIAGRRVLVLGAGTIGNLVAQSAKAADAKKVAIVDINETRLALAEQCGIDSIINTKTTDFDTGIREAFGEEGYDVVLDCAGVQSALAQSLNQLDKGGVIVIVAVYSQPVQVDLTLVQDRELKIFGSLMYQRKDYERAIEYLATGKMNIEPLISRHFPLSEYAGAYDYAISEAESVMKVLIDVAEEA